ncbi:hypothetical protein GIB67_023905 [Kingdonia uniflora]|uniref:Uncharacterized protein n=1 Tax=Kingdonia uniflora TaxID=39325 RepID=A0A7J7NG86_9MAGN|nr:hypothetical protein GIB67_023905 [Kingdonia uniflora]
MNKRQRCSNGNGNCNGNGEVRLCCSYSASGPIGRKLEKSENVEETKRGRGRVEVQVGPSFSSSRPPSIPKQGKFYSQYSPRDSAPQSRDAPPRRDIDIVNEEWGINMFN